MAKKTPAKKESSRTQKPTTIFLVRHGQNQWVNKNKLAGHLPGVHLNKLGKQQAKLTGKYLAGLGLNFDAVFCSPLERTMETAQLLLGSFGNISITPCPEIGEVDYGDWTGKSIAKLAKHPQWQVIQYHPGKAQFPNGESLLQVQNRAVSQIDSLVTQRPGQTLLFVSHADVIKSVVAHYLGVHIDLFQRIVISPASITTVTFTPLRPMITRVNDTSHLQKLHSPQNS